MLTPTGSAATTTVPATSDPRDEHAYRRMLGLVRIGFFVQTITTDSGLASLPLRLLLKDQLHLLPTAVAGFSTIANVAWYLKPIAGAFVDMVRIRGSRYRSYLLIGAGGAAAGWLLMGIVPRTYADLLLTLIAVNAFLMLISTVLGGYMVTESRAFQATGRMASLRTIFMGLASFVASPVAGYLATRAFGLTAGINAALLVVLFFYVFFGVRETPERHSAGNRATATRFWNTLQTQIQPLLRAKTFWAAVGMTFLVVITPGFGTLLLYYQKDTLHFSSQFIGNLGLVAGVTGGIGTVAYIALCRRLSLRTLLYVGTILAAVTTALFEMYRSPGSALWITGIASLVGAVPGIALLDLAARASPVRNASLSYSLLMAVHNLGVQLSDVGGSWLHDRFHLSLFTLIWINAGTTLLALVAVPFLPGTLVDKPDGRSARPAAD